MLKKILPFLFAVCLVRVLPGADPVFYQQPAVFHSGEELVYKVKWSFIRVGTLRLLNEGLTEVDGEHYYKLRFYIDSADGIPFVNIHDHYESYTDSNAVPVIFKAFEKDGDHLLRTTYKFDHDIGTISVFVEEVYPDKVIIKKNETIPAESVYRDVLSLLFFARIKSSEKYEDVIIPTFAINKKDSCFFKKTGEIQETKYEDEDVSTYYLSGKLKFIGIAGIKDDFEGWFSTDPQRVPLKAKMKAFFGSVTIDLEDFKNWDADG